MSDEIPPIVEVGNAIAKTVINPSIPVLAEDLLLVHNLVTDVKSKLAGKHLSLGLIFQTLFNVD